MTMGDLVGDVSGWAEHVRDIERQRQPLCCNCRYWDVKEVGELEGKARICNLMPEGSGPPRLAWVWGGGDLATTQDFGCVLHEPKPAYPAAEEEPFADGEDQL